MIDVKKLTRDFLGIAVLISVAALLMSNPGLYSGVWPSTEPLAQTSAPIPDNAFVADAENLPPILQPNLAGNQSNLTDATAQNIAQVILALNPGGPRTIGDSTGFIIPTTTLLTAYLAETSPWTNLTSIWTSPDNEQVTPAPTDDIAAEQQYARGFQNIMDGTLSSPGFTAKLKTTQVKDVDTNFITMFTGTLNSAISQMKELPTPTKFTPFESASTWLLC